MTNEGGGALGDMLSLMSEITKGSVEPYDDRKLARHDGPVGVSTIWAEDVGQYETALLAQGTFPVERYDTREDAETGHARWVEFAADADGKEITELGYGSTIEAELITLEAQPHPRAATT